jgi:hypothetical protein
VTQSETSIQVIREPLKFYVDRINNNERTVFPRWGDVEWFLALRKSGNCRFFEILEKKGKNSSGHRFHPFLTKKLSSVLRNNKDYLWGMQPKSMREMGPLIDDFLTKNKITHPWYWSDVFHRANCNGQLFPIIEVCRDLKMIYVGPKHIAKVQNKVFGKAVCQYIEVPLPDCCLAENQIFDQLSKGIEKEKPDLVGFSAAMLTNLLIDKLYGETDCHMIDFGSVWDIYAGVKSRSMFRNGNKWPALINQNLGLSK